MDNKTRGAPNKDIIKTYYENNDITLKELSEKFNINYDRIRNWKSRDKKKGVEWIPFKNDTVIHDTIKDDTPKQTVTVTQNKKQALSKAKSMVISGETIKKASEKTGVSLTTLENHSAKEKWLESRKAYNNYIYKELISEQGQQHLKDRKNAVVMSRYISAKMFKEIQDNKLDLDKARMYKEVATVVEKTIAVAGKMLGITDVDKLEIEETDMIVNISFEEEGQNGD